MLKTIEEQHTAPNDYSNERLVPVEKTQPAQITAAEQVLEPEPLENIQALIDELRNETKRRARRTRIAYFVWAGVTLPRLR